MKYAAIDIGTNSMRLLIAEVDGRAVRWLDRRTTVTGLGKGVDASGRLSVKAVDRTVAALTGFGQVLAAAPADIVRAVATSATRDAHNRDEFLDRAEQALGVRPEMISGEEEARLAFMGATHSLEEPAPYAVIDVGGGSTEFVCGSQRPEYRTSVDIGSVRLTDRVAFDHPAAVEQVENAQQMVDEVLAAVELPAIPATAIGVAGTFTSLSAISQDLPAYDPGRVHASKLSATRLGELILYLAGLTLRETEAIPSLDPARAPVILAGSLVAEQALRRTGTDSVLISEHDTLDGIVLGLAQA